MNQRRITPSTSMLIAFDASVRNGSFTEAAQELNLTQGAISRQVAALEYQLGVKLFIRDRKLIQLTAAGKIYSHEINSALQIIRNASLKAMTDPQSGILNLAILPTFAMRWLLPNFPDFLKCHPQITVNFYSKLSPFNFKAENIHAAIHFGLDDWPEADSTFLMAEETVPVAAPSLLNKSLPLLVNDLAELPLLHLATRPDAWEQWFKQNDLNFKLNKGMVFEQFAIVTQAAAAGLGVALLPRFLIEKELNSGELVELINRPIKTDSRYYLVSPEHYTNYPPTIALCKWLVKQAS